MPRPTCRSGSVGYEFLGGIRTVDVHMRRWRAKLGTEHEQMIGTVRNVDYKFVRPSHGDLEMAVAPGETGDANDHETSRRLIVSPRVPRTTRGFSGSDTRSAFPAGGTAKRSRHTVNDVARPEPDLRRGVIARMWFARGRGRGTRCSSRSRGGPVVSGGCAGR
jgi:hypothetical protein